MNVVMIDWLNTLEDRNLQNDLLNKLSNMNKYCNRLQLYKYAPHFCVDKSNGDVSLVPFTPLHPDETWKSLIGYCPHNELSKRVRGSVVNDTNILPLDLEVENYDAYLTHDNYAKLMNLDIWPKTGRSLKPLERPLFGGELKPFGAIFNFITVPVSMQFAPLLSKWLQLRMIHPPQTEDALFNLVQRVLDMGDDGPAIVEQVQLIGDGQYIVWGVVKTDHEVEWITENAMFDVLRNKFFKITDDSLTLIFGERKNGVRHRAELYTTGGHINATTMKLSKVKKISDNSDVIMFTAYVTPTVKSKQYWTTVMVDFTNGAYLHNPYSGCDCPAGQFFCSHMLGLLTYVGLIQEFDDLDYNAFINTLPLQVLSLQSLPLGFTFIYS